MLVQAFVGAVFTTILGLAMSVYVQKIVDHVIPEGNRALLNLLGVAMLVILAFKLLLGVFQSLLSMRTAQQIDAALILAYYRHLMRLPQPFFDSMRVGEITSRVADAVKVRNFLNGALLNLVLNPLILVFSLGALEFIEQLPQGFLTHLSENGGNLSGGQHQRLALVRALYLDAPILLLDEPSSALDAKAEQTLVALCERQRALGRTVIVAAHTPAFLAVADQVVRFAGGRVCAVESHARFSPATGATGSAAA